VDGWYASPGVAPDGGQRHLREDWARRVESGESEEQAFDGAMQGLGQASLLKDEFAKLSGKKWAWLRKLEGIMAGASRLLGGRNIVNARTNRWVVGAGIVAIILGAILSRVIEPGVRVEKIMVTGNTPAIRLSPAAPGPHPIALLAHGATGSKENLFRFGEALAAAGFDCYSIDQPGHGESPQSLYSPPYMFDIQEFELAHEAVDAFIGHSYGGWVGAWSVHNAGFRPKIFVGIGADTELAASAEDGPPLVMLFGRFDYFGLQAPASAQVVISPWSEHILEFADPVLVNAAVKAACSTLGKPVPAAPTAWLWRVAGAVLAIAGAFVLMFRLPELHPGLARMRRFILPAVLLIAIGLTMGTWTGVTPQLRRIPQQVVLLPVIWLAVAGLSRLRLPRWILTVVIGILALGCEFAYNLIGGLLGIVPCFLAISALLMLPSALVGRIATRGGSTRDGDVAMAIFASYAIGQYIPLFY